MNVEATKVPGAGKEIGHKKHKKAPVFAGSYGLARKKVPGAGKEIGHKKHKKAQKVPGVTLCAAYPGFCISNG